VETDELDDAKGAAYLLAHRTDGQVFDAEVAEVDIDVLAGEIGDLEARLARADVVQERFLSHDFRP
jgi:hypothetical protein